MKTLKTLTTAVTLTVGMGVASLGFATPTNPTVPTAPATTAPVASTQTSTQTTTKTTAVKKTPKKSMPRKATTSKSSFTCKDGSLSKAKTTRGACSGHGGIAK